MTEQFANFAQGVLAAPITAAQTTISITPTDYTGRPAPSNFPSQGNFRITVQSFDVTTQIPTSAPEIMLVTSVAGNTFTVQRGAESSTAIAFASGAQVIHIATAAVMTALSGGTSPLTTKGDVYGFSTVAARVPVGADGTVLTADSTQPTGLKYAATSGTGTVTTVSVATANGFSGTVANATTTPAITVQTSVTGIPVGNGTAFSASNVTNNAQTKAAIVPNTAPSSGQILVGNAGGTAYAPQTASGDLTIDSSGAHTLATVNSNVGTFNGTTANGKGLITAIAPLGRLKAVRAATTGDLGGTYNNGASGVGATITNSGAQVTLSIDSVNLFVGDRICVKNQGTAFQNGIYSVTNAGSGSTNWVITRSSDYDNSTAGSIFEGTETVVSEGTTNAGVLCIMTTQGAITVGSTGLIWIVNSAGSIAGGYAASVSNSDGTLTISPTTGAVVASIALGHPNSWSGQQTFTNPIVGTQSSSDNSTKGASTAYVTTAVNNAIAGVNPAVAVQYATVAAGDTSALTYSNGVSGVGATLTGANNTATAIDGHTFVVGDVGVTRVLVKNDTQSPSGAFNGVYLFTALHTAGTGDIFTRALDYDTPSDINNTGAIPVISGTANAQTSWVETAAIVTVGTDPLSFTQFSLNPTTLATLTGTQTLTNKRITKRVSALSAGSATPAINTDTTDVVHITAQSAAITSFTTNLTGTPVDGDSLRISITDNGTARALTFGASFEASTVALPTTTVINARLDCGFFWNTETSKWRCVAVA